MTSARSNTPSKSSGGRGGGSGNTLLDLIDRILDKGLVIDAWVRVSVLNIELLTIEARVVVASVETYLRYAEAIGNTALASAPHPQQAQQQGIQQPGQQQGQQPAQALPQPQQNGMPQWQAQPQQQAQQQAQPQPAQQMQARPQQQQAQPQRQQQVQAPPPQAQPQEQQNNAQ